jgi:hypothetical protein
MAIKDWGDNQTETLAWTILGVWFLTMIVALFTYDWYTNNQERQMMIDHNLSQCSVYNPNTGKTNLLWQKECQVIKLYPGVIINN